MIRKIIALAALSAIYIVSATPARGADHYNLDEGIPTQVRDAYPLGFGDRELQFAFQYDRTDERKDRFTLEPRLEAGVAPNLQVSIFSPLVFGNDDTTDSGDVAFDALYNVNQETRFLPAVAFTLGAYTPTGEHAAGLDLQPGIILTKTLGTSGMDRLHLDVSLFDNFGREEDDREDRYRIVAGYSRRILPDAVLVLDYIREQQPREGLESNILEAGVRYQLDPQTVVGIGAGVGIGDDSPNYRLLFGFSRSF